MFDIETAKEEIVTVLRNNLYPRCTDKGDTIPLSDASSNYSIAQSFKPYSTLYGSGRVSTISVCLIKEGTPTEGLNLYVTSSSNSLPSGTLATATISPTSVGTVDTTVSVAVTFSTILGSYTEYFIKLVPNNSISATDRYKVVASSVDVYYLDGSAYKYTSSWSALSKDIYFTFSTPNWIYKDFPRFDLSKYSYPRIAVSVTRRDARQRFIDRRIIDLYYRVDVGIFSRYVDEIERITSLVDNYLFENRTSVSSFRRLDPGRMSPLVVARRFQRQEPLWYRAVPWIGIHRLVASSVTDP